MTLKECKECKKEVSNKAKKCPHCGVNKPTGASAIAKFFGSFVKISLTVFAICFLVIMVVGIMFPTPNTTSIKLTEEKQKSKTREEQLSHAFSSWNGAHKVLERMIINAMNDPDSYEHIATRYLDHGETLFVISEYRGRNVFGGMVKQTVRARVDTVTGEVIEIVAQE